MSDAYGRISSDIRRLGDALVLLRQQQQDPNAVAPHLVQAYKAMLQQQDALFAQQTDALYNAQRQDYLRLEAASTQFANEIRVASEYALLTAEERAREQGKAMLGNLNELAEHNALSFSRLEQWARFEERQRLDLAEEQGRQKQEQEQTKKEMQALKKTGGEMQDKMKEYEEKSRKFWRAIKEKEAENRRVQARVLRLAAAAKELKRKGKASGEKVKELRKLAKATAKSARAASQHADDLGSASPPAETATENPETPAAPPPPTPPQPPQAGPEMPPGWTPPEGWQLPPPAKPPAKPPQQPPKPPKTPRANNDPDDSDDSSSSSSSSDSVPSESDGGDSDNETLNSLLRAFKKRQDGKKDRRIAKLEDLVGIKRRVKEKKIQIPKPAPFKGTLGSDPSYQRWKRQMNNYLHYNKGIWDDDADLIRVVGSYLDKEALDWFQTRSDDLEANLQEDTFHAFLSAMDERFKTDFEDKASYYKFSQVKYGGDVLRYIDTMRSLNQKAKLSGLSWREHLKNGLTYDLQNDLSKVQGGEPDEDDALIGAIKQVGLAKEKFLMGQKAKGGQGKEAGAGGQGKNTKHKRGQEQASDAQKKKEEGPACKDSVRLWTQGSMVTRFKGPGRR